MRRFALPLLAALSVLIAGPLHIAHAQAYQVTNLVSDGSVSATTTDPNFLNPWGISVSSTWWIDTANTGFSYVVPSTTDAIAFKVVIPPASGSTTATGTPAGSVTTSGASGMILSNGTKASFLFSTLDGTIDGWNSKLGTTGAVVLMAINNSSAGASYPGLAILNANATTSYILAPNFGAGNKVEVYDQTFKPTTLSGSFTDPNLPAGYSPWSIHILNNQIWVAYALRGSSAPYIPATGSGNGLVDVFDINGNFVARAVTGGNLNAPWGVAFAPASFGIFSNDLLIGNFGDGKINVYDPHTYAYLGQLMNSSGQSLVYASLWDLLAGGTPVLNSTAVSGGSTSDVYFTAGLANETHGLFAGISSATVANATPTFGFSASTGALTVTDGSSGQATLSVTPVNGFSGTMTFYCTGLPTSATCAFSPSTVSVTSSAPATTQLTINTSATQMARIGDDPLRRKPGLILSLATLLPFSLLLFRRRRTLRDNLSLLIPVLVFTLGVGALILGCSTSSPPPESATPTGQSQVTVVAMSTAGSPQQQTTIALTVQ